jgi:hypothetical protein
MRVLGRIIPPPPVGNGDKPAPPSLSAFSDKRTGRGERNNGVLLVDSMSCRRRMFGQLEEEACLVSFASWYGAS